MKLTTAMEVAGITGGNLVKVSSLCSHSLSGVCFPMNDGPKKYELLLEC